jgi:Ca2+-binding RTX toxin-like protein
VGGAGADRLAGGKQDDRLEGGAGADVFRFAPGSDADRVDDWTPGEDRIDLRAFDFAGRGEALARASQAGDDVVIDLGAWEATITLLDSDVDDLGRGDFIV